MSVCAKPERAGDGNVRFISETIDHKLYAHLGTRDGGESVQVPE